MTTDYEKKYNEALNWMRELYPGLHGATKEDAEHFFPELAESEDERIRKAIIKSIEEDSSVYEQEVSKEQMLAYLEKQKEQNKCPEFCSGHCVGCERNEQKDYRKLYEDIAKSEWFKKAYEGKSLGCDDEPKEQKPAEVKDPFNNANFVRGYESGYADAKREQKPAQTDDEKEYIRTLKNLISGFIRDKQPEDVAYYQRVYDWLDGRHIEQKPAEWSEFDKGALKDAICAADILGNDEFFNKGNPNLAKAFRVAKDWLKSLPERLNLQPKQEWSEEEKDKLNSIERLIVNANAHGNYLIGDKEAIDLQHFIRSIVKPTTNLVEWSGEDEHRRTDAIYFLESAMKHYADTSEIEKTIDWLKSLPERLNLQPKQEWSEEEK